MRISDITEAMVRRQFEAAIFQRGESYLKQGAVHSPKARENGMVLTAEVQGSDIDPYEVRIVLGKTHIDSAECSCPYSEEWDGWCKHIAAVLLTAVRFPERFGDVPPLANLLKDLDRDTLHALLTELATSDDHVADRIADLARSYANRHAAKAAEPKRAVIPTFAPVDTDSLRKQVRSILRRADMSHGSDAYWQTGPAFRQVEKEILSDVRKRLERGDTPGALAMLDAVTGTLFDQYENIDDSEGESLDLFEALDLLWTETILSAGSLPSPQEKTVRKLLERGQKLVADYDMDVFDAALAALRNVWSDSNIDRVLSGVADRLYFKEQEQPFAETLSMARVTVLKRQGRLTEAFRLAAAAGLIPEALSLLVELDRKAEIPQFARTRLNDMDDAMHAIRLLEAVDALDIAVPVGEIALQIPTRMPEERAAVATWLRDAAEGLGDMARAGGAAMVALRNNATFANWQAAKRLAPPADWPILRTEILNRFRKPMDDQLYTDEMNRVEIFLSEGLLDDALQIAANSRDYKLLDRVASAATETRPEVILRMSQRVAERIMDNGESSNYEIAQRWLQRMKEIQTRQGQTEQWNTYLKSLMETHKRKYKLMALLKELD